MKTFWIGMIVFAGINVLDLILTLAFFESEINPLVINNPAIFYMVKLFTTWLLLTICIGKLVEVKENEKRSDT